MMTHLDGCIIFGVRCFSQVSANNMAAENPDDLLSVEQKYHLSGYEYLDHPADVQLHSWGTSLSKAFEQAAVAMFGVMTEIETIDPIQEKAVEASGHDLESLLFNFLDECLFVFSVEPYLCASQVKITELDDVNFSIKATLKGETFNLSKHPQGTEVKAITYSNLQIHKNLSDFECYVIIDI